MPSLTLFGQKTPVAGDDLQVYAAVMILLRLLELCLGIALIVHVHQEFFQDNYEEEQPCLEEADVDLQNLRDSKTIFLAVCVILSAVGIIQAQMIFIVSRRGTPTDIEPRSRPLQRLCHMNLTVLFGMRLFSFGTGYYVKSLVDDVCEVCSSGTAATSMLDLCVGIYPDLFFWLVHLQLVETILNAAVIIYLFTQHKILRRITPKSFSNTENQWKVLCQCCCTLASMASCCLMGGKDAMLGDFTDVAILFADFFDFHGTLDVTPTDMVAGLLMVQELQSKREHAVKAIILEKSTRLRLSDFDMDINDGDIDDDDDNDNDNGDNDISQEAENPMGEQASNTGIEVEYGDEPAPKPRISSSGSNPQVVDEVNAATASSRRERSLQRVIQNYQDNRTLHGITYRLKRYRNKKKKKDNQHRPIPPIPQQQPIAQQQQQRDDGENNNNNNNEISSGRNSSSGRTSLWNTTFCWEPHASPLLDPGNSEDQLVIAEGARYMRLSLSIYTWIMYCIVNRPCTGIWILGWESVRRNCCGAYSSKMKNRKKHDDAQEVDDADNIPTRHDRRRFAGDGCCRIHSTAFLKESGIIDDQDIVYASFLSAVVASPYAVVLDHEWKSIVLVIRGTQSLEDVLTDLSLTPTNLEQVGTEHGFDGSTYYAHSGMLATALWILKDLKEQQVLEDLFADDGKYKHYRLRVTGHSLGAGCAALVALLLRPKYPNLRSHCFSPPGCTLSEDAAIYMEQFLTTYILDSDIVPRASLAAMENLRQDCVEMISRIKVSKDQVFRDHGCCRTIGETLLPCRSRFSEPGDRMERLLYNEEETPDCVFIQEWKKYQRLYNERKTERGDARYVELYPPGKIVHMFGTTSVPKRVSLGAEPCSWLLGTFASCVLGFCVSAQKKEYECRWADRLDFREIRISNHFVHDHIPINVLNELEAQAEKFHLEPPFLPPTSRRPTRTMGKIEESDDELDVDSQTS